MLAVAVLSAGTAVAQGETDSLRTEKQDTSDVPSTFEVGKEGLKVNLGEKKNSEEERKRKKDEVFDFGFFNGFDLGFNAFMVNGDLNLPAELENFEQKLGNSTNVQIRVVNLSFRMARRAELNFALALDYNDWALENNVTLQPDQEQVTFLEEDINFKKNKFKAKYLALPINLELGSFSGVTITGGFEPQFLLRGRVKQRSSERGKTKVDDNFNLREFRYAWVGRIGFEGFSVFCRYYPKSIFTHGEGPDIQNISFGVGWGF